jgi:hypothetical protein
MTQITVIFGFNDEKQPIFYVFPLSAHLKHGTEAEFTWRLIGPQGASFDPGLGIEWDTLAGNGVIDKNKTTGIWTLKASNQNDTKDPVRYKYTIMVNDGSGALHRYKDDPEVVNDPTSGGGMPDTSDWLTSPRLTAAVASTKPR